MHKRASSSVDVLSELKARIAALDALATLPRQARALPLGLAAIDAALPWGGLLGGALHEVSGPVDDGAAAGFCGVLLARLAQAAPVLWIAANRELHGPGLAALGLDPGRLILIEAPRPRDRLWAFEEALRSPGLAAALGEIAALDLTASRRLQLAAEASGVTGLILRQGAAAPRGASAARTRWHVAALPSRTAIGVGAPRWRVELAQCRGGGTGSWDIEWRKGGWHDVTQLRASTAPDVDLAAAPGHGPTQKIRALG